MAMARRAEKCDGALADLDRRLQRALANRLTRARDDIAGRRRALTILHGRLAPALARVGVRRGEHLERVTQRLALALANRRERERNELARRRQAAQSLAVRLAPAAARLLARRRDLLAGRAQLLASLGYTNVLARGFAVVRDDRNKPLRAARDVAAGQHVSIEFADARVGATADGGTESAPRRAPRKKTGAQGSLF